MKNRIFIVARKVREPNLRGMEIYQVFQGALPEAQSSSS
jgi:hypothetical protein